MPKEFIKSLFWAVGLHGALLGILIFTWPFLAHSVFSFDRYRVLKVSLVSPFFSSQSVGKDSGKSRPKGKVEPPGKNRIEPEAASPVPEKTSFKEEKPIPSTEERGEKKGSGQGIALSLSVEQLGSFSSENSGGGPVISKGKGKESPVSLLTAGGSATVSYLARPRYGQNREPYYPVMAREQGWQGTALLKVLILRNGSVGSLEIIRSSGYGILDRSALTAVKDWKFIPAQKDGQPVEIGVEIPVTFRLE